MKKIKHILFICLWSILGLGLLLCLGFVNKEQDEILCKSMDIKVNQDNDLYFLNNIDVARLIKSRNKIVGQPKAAVNTTDIEKALNSHPNIANAEVSISIDGKLKVEVKQRKPILRLFNVNDESYYMDDEGMLMPLSEKYTAKVLIANGKIVESYAKNYKRTMNNIATDSAIKARTMFDELFAMATFIDADDFWRAQIQQIYINNNMDMEIVPIVGDQKIIFGDTTDMEEKFKKLLIFYRQGLNTTGWWNKYSAINLKFKNQIVCTKK